MKVKKLQIQKPNEKFVYQKEDACYNISRNNV